MVDYSGAGPIAEIRSFFDAPGADVRDGQRSAATVPVRFVPIAPSFTPSPNVAPMSEQDLRNPSGPPGSNFQPSFGPGYG